MEFEILIGYGIELDADQAEELGAFEELAISLDDAKEANEKEAQ